MECQTDWRQTVEIVACFVMLATVAWAIAWAKVKGG